MRKKKFYKKHKIAIILGLLATANLSIIGFATFVVPERDITTQVGNDITINVGSKLEQTAKFEYNEDKSNIFTLHPSGFYDSTNSTNPINYREGCLTIALGYESSFVLDNSIKISLSDNLSTSLFTKKDNSFIYFAGISLVIGSERTANPNETSDNTISYTNFTAKDLGIVGNTSGTVTLKFTFYTNVSSSLEFYENIFKPITNDKNELTNDKNKLTFNLVIETVKEVE